jgi:hypothetical protein
LGEDHRAARFEDREGLFGVEGDGLVGRVAVVVRGDELDGAMLRLVIDLGVHVGEVDWLIRVYVGWLAGCKMVTLFEREQSKLCGQYLIFFIWQAVWRMRWNVVCVQTGWKKVTRSGGGSSVQIYHIQRLKPLQHRSYCRPVTIARPHHRLLSKNDVAMVTHRVTNGYRAHRVVCCRGF